MKSAAIMMALIISLSVSTSFAATTKVAAYTTTTTKITTSDKYPTVGQSVTFTATLKAGTKSLSGKPITIYHYVNGVRYTDTTKTTNSAGQIKLTRHFTSSGIRTYYAKFAGDARYKGSTSSVLKITVH
jgi:hypothetical protein